MKNLSFILLSSTRVFMFLLLSSFHFQLNSEHDFWKLLYTIGAMVLFVGSHFIQFLTKNPRIKLICVSIDFLLSAGFGALFPKDSGLLYLIFFGVISTTVFLVFENKTILRIFLLALVVSWMAISYEKYVVNGEFSLSNNLLSIMYVVYGAVVGSLIRNLLRARETISNQFEQLNDSHEALRIAHDHLNDYSKQVEELTVIRERNQIAREIHDTVGHKMTALLVQLQLAKEVVTIQPKRSKDILQTCEVLTRESLNEIRLSVRTLKEEDNLKVSFLHVLREMLHDFSNLSGLEAQLTINGDPSLVPSSLQPTIKRIVQESLTNAKRHGLATQCHVSINILNQGIELEIEDNGQGAQNIVPGFGLINMKERIMEHGGTIHFKSNEEKGFSVFVQFPLKILKWSSVGVIE